MGRPGPRCRSPHAAGCSCRAGCARSSPAPQAGRVGGAAGRSFPPWAPFCSAENPQIKSRRERRAREPERRGGRGGDPGCGAAVPVEPAASGRGGGGCERRRRRFALDVTGAAQATSALGERGPPPGEFTMTNEEPLPKKVRLSEADFKVLPRDELILRWKQYEAYVQALEGKYTDLNSNDVTGLRESEEKLKQQQQESARRENILVMRLATKEQEMQECTWAPLRRVWLHLLYSPPREVFMHIGKIPLNLLFSRLNSPSALRLCLYVRCFNPLIIFTAFRWPHPNITMSPILGDIVLGSPELDPVLQMSHQCRVERKGHLPRPVGSTPPNAARMPMKICSGAIPRHFPSSKTTILILLLLLVLLINSTIRDSSNNILFLLNF
uniref:Pre-mRNA-splicing regulator WTAP n=1 Tax=Calidris pygmaea TaxID=425635 RepID=A0A8C3PR01_9CHAR